MKIRTAGMVEGAGFAILALAVASLTCGAAFASDVEQQIPVFRDRAGSGLTAEISREGNRRTATPFLTVHGPTIQRIEDRVAKKMAQPPKDLPPEAPSPGSLPRNGWAGTSREGSGRPETTLSSLPPVPGEITIRGVRDFLKGLRSSRNGKPAQEGAAAAPERRLERTRTSPR